ncbi:MAG: RNA polymerase sigma factor [Candidatus Aminicenantes bacterium]|jgi:RNA polymerase sigma-70 factor (ECF subfamily)
MNETAVVQLAQQGDADAFRRLFEENKRRVFALAYQYTKNKEDAEDILQETFIKAFNSLDKFKVHRETNFSSWLYRIGINASIDHLRKNKMKKNNFIDSDQLPNISSDDGYSNPEQAARIKEIRTKLDQTLHKLPAGQRMVFILRHYQQFSVKEIADHMRCSEGSVKKQLFRAFQMIKEHFQSLFPEDSYEM